MASADILSQTLSSITSIKLDEIAIQRSTFEDTKEQLLESAKSQPTQRDKVATLLRGLEAIHKQTKLSRDTLDLCKNVKKFVGQADRDPSVSPKLQEDWESKFVKQLDIQSVRYEYAALYGKMVNEWLSASEDKPDTMDIDHDRMSDDSVFEKVGRKEMHEQRATWQEYVFKPLATDTVAIKQYLEKLFNSDKAVKTAFERLKKDTEHFEKSLSTKTHFDEATLRPIISGLLRSDLLTDEKSQLLRDFLNNKVVLSELADVLNMRMGSLDRWGWDHAGTPVEQRRQLNGRYRFYHDEDLLQTILLRHIGVIWSVHFKCALKLFQETVGVWKASTPPVPKSDQDRREWFLGTRHSRRGDKSVEETRRNHFESEVFLEQLMDKPDEERGGYGDDREAETADTRKSGQQIAQTLLHTLAAEIVMKTRLNEEVTVVRTDFKWFGPSLPHSTMFAVLSYFGVSERWIDFFRRVLEAPMKFVQDGADAPVQIRKRGTPISGPMSDMLGETVLFCLDFAFNQNTDGVRMYRLHDDIWFWGNEKTCIQGWKVMTDFAQLTGLDFSEEKTGSVKITRKPGEKCKVSKVLPQGPVVWGFLKLDSETGRFLIDQEKVDKHIEELRLQLDACKSVFDWIQAWNIYGARFFTTNFGKPAQSFGLAHIDMLLDTFARIQAKLFDSTGGSVTSTLQRMITDRFSVKDIPEGYLYFPMSMGGLDLKNPFIELYLVRPASSTNPDKYMDQFFSEEEAAYRKAKSAFIHGGSLNRHASHSMTYATRDALEKEPFMSFEEYTRYREQTSDELDCKYRALISEPTIDGIITAASTEAQFRGRYSPSLSPYLCWIYQLYASDMTERFGGLEVVEKGMLPVGIISMFRASRFKWQG